MRKGIGPRGLGAPKSVAKQTADYYNLDPRKAKTYADSTAVETSHFSSQGKRMGEIAGKVASGGTFTGGGFTAGTTPNSADAKKMMEDNRKLIKNSGGDYKDAYKK